MDILDKILSIAVMVAVVSFLLYKSLKAWKELKKKRKELREMQAKLLLQLAESKASNNEEQKT